MDFQEEDRTMDMQTVHQNYLLPRNENVNNQQGSPAKRIIYNDNNLVGLNLLPIKFIPYVYFILHL